MGTLAGEFSFRAGPGRAALGTGSKIAPLPLLGVKDDEDDSRSPPNTVLLLRPQMTQDKSLADRVGNLATQYAIMKKYLQLRTWTPTMGALLVCGIQAPPNCSEIPKGGVGLDGELLNSSASGFHGSRQILLDWGDYLEDQSDESKLVAEISPIDFLDWCIEEKIRSIWLDQWCLLAGFRVHGSIDLVPELIALAATPALSTGTLAAKLSKTTGGSSTTEEGSTSNINFGIRAPTRELAKNAIRATTVTEYPVGLSTPDIAAIFHGIAKWNSEKWSKNLTQVAWTKEAITQRGRRGKGGVTLWNPACLAILIHGRRGATLNTLSRLFRANSLLAPWLNEWQQFEETQKYYS